MQSDNPITHGFTDMGPQTRATAAEDRELGEPTDRCANTMAFRTTAMPAQGVHEMRNTVENSRIQQNLQQTSY